jgi:DNA-binding transcriptional LysR family regulator
MDWDKLRIFQAAAEAGSFTHAGETLGLSQSAVSRQVGALEADLGAPLFHRHARGLILTEQGETLLAAVHDVSLKLDAVRSRLIDSRDKPHGDLRVTTTLALGRQLAGAAAGRIRRTFSRGEAAIAAVGRRA